MPELKEYIEQSVVNGLELALADRLNIQPQLESREDYEKYIKAMLHFSRQKSSYKTYSEYKLVSFNSSKIRRALSNWENLIVNDYYDGSENEYRDFLIKTLSTSEFPHIVEMDLISLFLSERKDALNIPIEYSELIDINIIHFENYCKSITKMNSSIWHIFKFTWYYEYLEGPTLNKKEYIPQQAILVFKTFILDKDIEGFLKSIIFNDRNSEDFYLSEYVFKLFSKKEFSEIIRTSTLDSEFINLFKRFYQHYEINLFKPVLTPELVEYFKEHPKT